MEASSVKQGGPSRSVEVPAPASWVSPSSFQVLHSPRVLGRLSFMLMPIVATLYHNDDRTVPPFIAPIPHEVKHYFVEPMILGCNGDIP